MENQLTTEQFQQLWSAIDKMEKAAVKVDKLFYVICGDKETRRGGIIDEMEDFKTQMVEFEKRLDSIDEILTKTKGYIAGAIAVGGMAGSVITIIIKTLFKI